MSPSRRALPLLLFPLTLLGAPGCSGDDAEGPLAIPAGCNPIAYEHDCLLPYPSDVFLLDDAGMPSGKRVSIPEAALPRTKNEVTFDFTRTHPVDGFSHHQPILALFPQGLRLDAKGERLEGVVFHTDDPAKSLAPNSKVLLVDAETKKTVPVWAEVDVNTDDRTQQALLIRPFVRLEDGHRYIVALQGLEDAAGHAIEAPRGFARIRDGKAAKEPALASLGTRYDAEIFPAIEAIGAARKDLVLAWDFTTASEEVNTRDMLAMRDDLIARLEKTPPAIENIKSTEYTLDAMGNAPDIWLRVEGTLRVPLYLENDQPGAKLHRDESGKVTPNGEAKVPFLLQVPWSAKPQDASFTPARILEYGHGFFGLREEIDYGFMRGFSNEQSYVTIAVDWWGMSELDVPGLLAATFADPGTAFDFVDRLHQAMANMIALSYAVKKTLPQVAAVQRSGKPLFDPDRLYYYGISQGAIFGVPMLSLNPILDRAALSVGGGPYSLMMSRSGSYRSIFSVVASVLEQPLTIQKFTAMSQSTWDRVDPITYAPHLLQSPYAKSPDNRHVLLQNGVGDHAVNNLATHVLARAAGIPLLDPEPLGIWGLESTKPPADDASVFVDFKLATLPGIYCKIPASADENEVHEGVRRNVKIKQQLDTFFQPDGTIQNYCEGPCDPD